MPHEDPAARPDFGAPPHVLGVAFPLIMAASCHGLKLFTDRLMLAQHSSAALSASMSAGVFSFTLMCLFLGTLQYGGTFVAQHIGAKQHDQVGPSVWQAIWVALGGGLCLALLSLGADPLFRAIGHDDAVRMQQVPYFRILTGLAIFQLTFDAILCFWGGRGKTWTIFGLTLITLALNIGINYVLIFGKFGCPQLGIIGAAIGTVGSSFIGLLVALFVFLRNKDWQTFNTWPTQTFDLTRFRRLLWFGTPTGLQMLLDLGAFNMFVQIMGWIGTRAQEASTIAFTINALAFIPMIGLGGTISILVGQAVGGERIDAAKRSVINGRNIALFYMISMGILFMAVPQACTGLFAREHEVLQPQTQAMAALFLRFIAIFLFFDAIYIAYSFAIKGAGDTQFSMWMSVVLSWCTLALPSLMAYHIGLHVNWLWIILIVHVIIAGTVFYLRYRSGKWETMSVIEKRPPDHSLPVQAMEIE